MTADFVVRPAEASDTEGILELVKLSLGQGAVPRGIEYWQWKHRDNPFGPSPALLALSAGRLVGLRAFLRWNWRAGGSEVQAVRAVDTATHPDWRGRGIFSRLTMDLVDRMRDEGVAFIFNTPNRYSRPGYLKMGWVSLGATTVWVRPVASRGLLRALTSTRARSRYAEEDQHEVQLGSPAADLFVEPGLRDLIAALPEPEDRLSTAPSVEYLKWRYVAVPELRYRAVWDIDEDDGAVLIFRSRNRGRLRELRLCQLLIRESQKSVRMGKELVRSLLRGSKADCLTAMTGANTAGQHLLRCCGFIPVPRLGPEMTVRNLVGVTEGPDPRRRSGWHLSIGDLELF